ncbi:MAG: tetratricopeptide repeat protein [Pseudomonadota bacterium]
MRAGLCPAAAVCIALTACAPTGPFIEEAVERSEAQQAFDEGQTHLRLGEYDLAYSAFITALRTGDKPAQALTGAGLALEAQGLLSRARDHFRQAAALAPGSDMAHNNLGVVLYRLGEYEAARQSFRVAFAVSSGRSTIAQANLRAAEQALAAANAPSEPVQTGLTVQRLGSSEYRLVDIAPEDVSG